MEVDIISSYVFTVLMVAVIVWDFRYLRIPNVLNLMIVVSYFACAFISGVDGREILVHVAFGIVSFAVFIAVALAGKMGGGDVKLAGGIGLWIGSLNGITLWMVSAGVVYLIMLMSIFLARKYKMASLLSAVSLPEWLDDVIVGRVDYMKARVPFGIPLAVGAIVWGLQ